MMSVMSWWCSGSIFTSKIAVNRQPVGNDPTMMVYMNYTEMSIPTSVQVKDKSYIVHDVATFLEVDLYGVRKSRDFVLGTEHTG